MRVILTLTLPDPWQPEGTLSDDAIRRQRAELYAAQQGLLNALWGWPYEITLLPGTTPQIGLDVPAETLTRVQTLVGTLVERIDADLLATPSAATNMVPIGIPYDPVAAELRALEGGGAAPMDPLPAIGVVDPIVGGWGVGGDWGAGDVIAGPGPIQPTTPILTTTPIQTAAGALAPPLAAAAHWPLTTWLLIGAAAWLLLRD